MCELPFSVPAQKALLFSVRPSRTASLFKLPIWTFLNNRTQVILLFKGLSLYRLRLLWILLWFHRKVNTRLLLFWNRHVDWLTASLCIGRLWALSLWLLPFRTTHLRLFLRIKWWLLFIENYRPFFAGSWGLWSRLMLWRFELRNHTNLYILRISCSLHFKLFLRLLGRLFLKGLNFFTTFGFFTHDLFCIRNLALYPQLSYLFRTCFLSFFFGRNTLRNFPRLFRHLFSRCFFLLRFFYLSIAILLLNSFLWKAWCFFFTWSIANLILTWHSIFQLFWRFFFPVFHRLTTFYIASRIFL